MNKTRKYHLLSFLLCAVLIAVGFAAAILSRKKEKEASCYLTLLLRHLLCAGITLVYLIVLSASTESVYIERMDVLLGVVFHILLGAMLSLAYLIRKWKKLVLVVPLTVFIIGFDVLFGIESFAHSTTGQIPAKTCMQINQALMQQIMEAENQKLDTVTIKVPQGDQQASNWPYTTNMGGRMIDTLRNHGMIEHLQAIYVEPDPDFYTAFDIERYTIE